MALRCCFVCQSVCIVILFVAALQWRHTQTVCARGRQCLILHPLRPRSRPRSGATRPNLARAQPARHRVARTWIARSPLPRPSSGHGAHEVWLTHFAPSSSVGCDRRMRLSVCLSRPAHRPRCPACDCGVTNVLTGRTCATPMAAGVAWSAHCADAPPVRRGHLRQQLDRHAPPLARAALGLGASLLQPHPAAHFPCQSRAQGPDWRPHGLETCRRPRH